MFCAEAGMSIPRGFHGGVSPISQRVALGNFNAICLTFVASTRKDMKEKPPAGGTEPETWSSLLYISRAGIEPIALCKLNKYSVTESHASHGDLFWIVLG